MLEETLDRVWHCTEREFLALRREAEHLTAKSFGNQRMLFNPLYISNVCINDCSYCGYRKSNHNIRRRTLGIDQILSEVRYVVSRGVTNLLLLAGEFPGQKYVAMFQRAISAIRRAFPDLWLGLECAPLAVQDYAVLKDAGVDCVILFQESYDPNVYSRYHSFAGPKSGFATRRAAISKAITAGVDQVGLGVLFGLGDPYQETLAMHRHAVELSEARGELRLRFSFPRLQQAPAQSVRTPSRYSLSDTLLHRAIVATRLNFPDARLVLTARETLTFRVSLMNILTDIGEGGSTVVGGYTVDPDNELNSQFALPGRSDLHCLVDSIREMGLEV